MIEILPVFLALMGVIALMMGVIYLMKWLLRHMNGGKGTAGLKVVSCTGVGQDKSIAAVRAGKKCLLVGISTGGINLLCELDDEDMALIENKGDVPSEMSGKSFAECLKYNMSKMGKEFITPKDKDSQ
ncbi:MAG: flagellar biosynthetic protein FliO [Oscillospiraceae bacterium]|nr:flagellar biosynthetic protein FliO [Oscillospiraceae bacterium]